jgi:CRP-like cAMP-binding protein
MEIPIFFASKRSQRAMSSDRLPHLLRANRLLADLDSSELQVVKDSMKLLCFEDNDTIIGEDDDRADNYFVLASGTVRVFSWRTGSNPIREYSIPGDGFGELALIHDVPRSASCIAVVRAILYPNKLSSFFNSTLVAL